MAGEWGRSLTDRGHVQVCAVLVGPAGAGGGGGGRGAGGAGALQAVRRAAAAAAGGANRRPRRRLGLRRRPPRLCLPEGRRQRHPAAADREARVPVPGVLVERVPRVPPAWLPPFPPRAGASRGAPGRERHRPSRGTDPAAAATTVGDALPQFLVQLTAKFVEEQALRQGRALRAGTLAASTGVLRPSEPPPPDPGLLLLPEADSLKASRSSIFLDDKPQPRGASGSLMMMGSEETVNPLNVRVPESQVSGPAAGSLFVCGLGARSLTWLARRWEPGRRREPDRADRSPTHRSASRRRCPRTRSAASPSSKWSPTLSRRPGRGGPPRPPARPSGAGGQAGREGCRRWWGSSPPGPPLSRASPWSCRRPRPGPGR